MPLSGALDPLSLSAANHLLGNEGEAAGLEILILGPTITPLDSPVAVALAGDLNGMIEHATGDSVTLPPWQAARLNPGDRLRILAPRKGIGYLAVSGGITTPPLLGSRSTYRRAGMGRFLAVGDTLPCGALSGLGRNRAWLYDDAPLRVMAGPQQDHFTAESLALFCGEPYLVKSDSDRMGLRLRGALLRHTEKGADILTDGVLPGAIQVPADGQPIVLLADAQTTGGYAKIAAVITADLPRLAHLRPGDAVRFQWVERQEAREALRQSEARFAKWQADIGRKPAGEIDNEALYQHNLISGATLGEDE